MTDDPWVHKATAKKRGRQDEWLAAFNHTIEAV